MAYNSGLTSVTGTVTSTDVEYNVQVYGATYNSAGAATIGTVPANKIWRIVGLTLSAGIDEVTAAGDYAVWIKLNGVIALSCSFRIGTTNHWDSNATSITFPPTCCPKLAAGQLITMELATTNQYATATYFFIEESV